MLNRIFNYLFVLFFIVFIATACHNKQINNENLSTQIQESIQDIADDNNAINVHSGVLLGLMTDK